MTIRVSQPSAPTGDLLIVAARAALARLGARWTPMRSKVLVALSKFGRPASAYDVVRALEALDRRPVGSTSVYRILELFIDAQVVQRIESQNAFVISAQPGEASDGVFLLCDRCGSAAHVDDHDIGSSVRLAAQSAGFRPRLPIIELLGTCGACSTQR